MVTSWFSALAKGEFHWVLALSDDGLSTPAVYRALDEHRERYRADISPAPSHPVVEANVLQALRAGDPDLLADCVHNDLQAPAMRLQPRLAATLELGEKSGALAGLVSGSGPTVAFLVGDRDASLELQVEAQRRRPRRTPRHRPGARRTRGALTRRPGAAVGGWPASVSGCTSRG